MLTAITREANVAIGNCELTFADRVDIDPDLVLQQHQQYQAALASLGCQIISVPTAAGLADSVFIEDTAIVLDEMAVLCRPGAVSRRPEVAGVAAVLKNYRTLEAIRSPGTVDGGDLLRVGKRIFAGLSTRTSEEGIEQLRRLVADYGYTVEAVATTQCLHLKSAVSEVAPGVLLINPDWLSPVIFGDYELIEVSADEAHAANALRIGKSLIYPSSFPRTLEILTSRGIDVTTVDMSELQKAEGAATCCSLIVTDHKK